MQPLKTTPQHGRAESPHAHLVCGYGGGAHPKTVHQCCGVRTVEPHLSEVRLRAEAQRFHIQLLVTKYKTIMAVNARGTWERVTI